MKVRRTPFSKFEVLCRNCKKIIVIDSPDDLQKEVVAGKEVFFLDCPMCRSKIVVDSILISSLKSEFISQIKSEPKSYLQVAHEACEKFNHEFEGTFDKL